MKKHMVWDIYSQSTQLYFYAWEGYSCLALSNPGRKGYFEAKSSHLLLQTNFMAPWFGTMLCSSSSKLKKTKHMTMNKCSIPAEDKMPEKHAKQHGRTFKTYRMQHSLPKEKAMCIYGKRLDPPTRNHTSLYLAGVSTDSRGSDWTCGPRRDPCRALPLPFCGPGFLPVPLTSWMPLVEAFPCDAITKEWSIVSPSRYYQHSDTYTCGSMPLLLEST